MFATSVKPCYEKDPELGWKIQNHGSVQWTICSQVHYTPFHQNNPDFIFQILNFQIRYISESTGLTHRTWGKCWSVERRLPGSIAFAHFGLEACPVSVLFPHTGPAPIIMPNTVDTQYMFFKDQMMKQAKCQLPKLYNPGSFSEALYIQVIPIGKIGDKKKKKCVPHRDRAKLHEIIYMSNNNLAKK